MELNQAQYGPQLNNAPVNVGILKTVPAQLFGSVRTSSTAGISGTPGSGASVFSPLDAATDAVSPELRIPSDYDNRKYSADDTWPGDTLKIRVCAVSASGGTTDKIRIGGFSYWRPGTSTAATELTRSATQTASQTVSATTLTEYEFDLSGLGLQAGNVVVASVMAHGEASTSTNPSTAVNVYAIEWQYRGHIIQTDTTDR